MVEYVERLDIDLQFESLFDREQPVYRRVQPPVIWRLEEVAWRVPQSPGIRSLEAQELNH